MCVRSNIFWCFLWILLPQHGLAIIGEDMTEPLPVVALPGTRLLERKIVWEEIIDGVRLYHEERLASLKPQRERYWKRDLTSAEDYRRSVDPQRSRFRKILGAVDAREPVSMIKGSKVGETDNYLVREVRWTVLKDVSPRPPLQEWPLLDVPTKIFGEGLLLEPKGKSRGFVVALPDADQLPESLIGLEKGVEKSSQFGRHLAENGFTVVVPVVIDRSNKWSRGTNRSSRSWIYSQSHELGRTVTGYEVQKIEALVDWFKQIGGTNSLVGVAGYGEGGLLALYAAALDSRIDAALVSGYFAPREEIWKEPVYRSLWGLLTEFGDAEIASLIAPRSLVVEYSEVPLYDGDRNDGKAIEPPAELWTHPFEKVEEEFKRISSLTGNMIGKRMLVSGEQYQTVPFGSPRALYGFMKMLGHDQPQPLSDVIPVLTLRYDDHTARMGRMVEQMVGHSQQLLRDSEYVRHDFVQAWSEKKQDEWREFYREEMIGWIHDPLLPLNPRTKLVEKQAAYSCYEVLIDVLPHVEMWGVLTLPNNIPEGEKRPVVVMQHGRGGNPYTALNEEGTYYGIARRLAERGFVVFTPFGNWTGETRFRWIDRIAKPAKNTLWSAVGRQHQQLFNWLKNLPFADDSKVALYGKSIGGQAASLIASMVPEYTLSINCAYFNEGARKESSVYYPTSFVFHVDSEMPMWNRAHTLQYAEMANLLIFPRPFMVEHGMKDGIAPPGWVEHEYEKVRRHYREHGMGEKTDLDHHEGGHIINGVKTIPFLHRYLDWREP